MTSHEDMEEQRGIAARNEEIKQEADLSFLEFIHVRLAPWIEHELGRRVEDVAELTYCPEIVQEAEANGWIMSRRGEREVYRVRFVDGAHALRHQYQDGTRCDEAATWLDAGGLCK